MIPPNFTFTSRPNIAPGWHVGPRLYDAAGIIMHPLQLSGHIPQPGSISSPMIAGANFSASSVAQMLQSSPHPFTINGRGPG